MKFTIDYGDSRWHYDLNKYPRGPYLVEQLDTTYDKLEKLYLCFIWSDMKCAAISPSKIGNIKSEESNYYSSILFPDGENGAVRD